MLYNLDIRFTNEALAKIGGRLEEVREGIRQDMSSVFESADEAEGMFFYNYADENGSAETNDYFGAPQRDDDGFYVLFDVTTLKSIGQTEEGPFKGMTIMVPHQVRGKDN